MSLRKVSMLVDLCKLRKYFVSYEYEEKAMMLFIFIVMAVAFFIIRSRTKEPKKTTLPLVFVFIGSIVTWLLIRSFFVDFCSGVLTEHFQTPRHPY